MSLLPQDPTEHARALLDDPRSDQPVTDVPTATELRGEGIDLLPLPRVGDLERHFGVTHHDPGCPGCKGKTR